jgi:TPR repeat protein
MMKAKSTFTVAVCCLVLMMACCMVALADTTAASVDDAKILYFWGARYQASNDYQKALDFFQKSADNGNVDAMYKIGYFYESGYGVQQQYGLAMSWYLKAAKQNQPLAMNNIGTLYHNGKGLAQDYGQAMIWFKKAADLDCDIAKSNIAEMYDNGSGVPADSTIAAQWRQKIKSTTFMGHSQADRDAVQWFQDSADKGDTEAMLALGDFYQSGFCVPQDAQKKWEWYQKSADKGNADALYFIAKGELNTKLDCDILDVKFFPDRYEVLPYFDALSLQQKERMAEDRVSRRSFLGIHSFVPLNVILQNFQKSADNGSAAACVAVGFLCQNGFVVDKKLFKSPQEHRDKEAGYKEAMTWYRKAADQGDPDAMTRMAYLYAKGLGVKRDKNDAMQLYQKAADKGNAWAMVSIGFLYLKGIGVDKNDAQAVQWYQKAADKGNLVAMASLGYFYKSGIGMYSDSKLSNEWFEKAMNGGDKLLRWSITGNPIDSI